MSVEENSYNLINLNNNKINSDDTIAMPNKLGG